MERKYVEEQIESILHQTYPNIKIYVRDDGSSDRTLDILEKYEENGSIILIKGKNVGFIKSFFELVKLCDGCEVDCISLGFNSVFNKAALRIMQKNIPNHSCGHDWWTYMVCVSMGEVIYDKRYTVKYRRHDNNVSAGGMKFIKFQLWRLKKFFFNDYFKNIRLQLKEFESLYSDVLKEEDRKLLRLFTRSKYNFIVALKKVFYKKRFRNGIFDEIALRVIFLIGKL